MLKLTFPITQVDNETDKYYKRGSRVVDRDGNEYVYLPGVASCAQYDVVVFNRAVVDGADQSAWGSVTRIVTGSSGPVGIAMGAITNTKRGWFQVKGVGWANVGNTCSSGSALVASGTAGTVSTVGVLGDLIDGMIAVSSVAASSGTVKVYLHYPTLSNLSG